MPRDGGNLGDDLEPGGPLEERAVVPRTAVLVTNADSPTAEQVVLQLILARCVRVLHLPRLPLRYMPARLEKCASVVLM